jgi:hypothetical protein
VRHPLNMSAGTAVKTFRSPSAPVRSTCFRRAFRTGSVAALLPRTRECTVSARAKARANANAGQSVGLQPYRVGTVRYLRKSSVAFQGGLQLQCAMNAFWSSRGVPPNPSIEGTASGLRPPAAPHVKR